MNKKIILLFSLFCFTPQAFGLQLSDSEKKSISPETVEGKVLFENETMKIVESNNLLFKIAKDRPMEKGPGTVGPIEIDAYIYYKFEELAKQLRESMTRIEKRLDQLESKIVLDPAVKVAIEEQIRQQKEKAKNEALAKQPKVLSS